MARGFAALVAAVVLSVPAFGQPVTWVGGAAGGSWATAANWSSNPLLPGLANTAVFGANITGPATVTLDGNQLVGAIQVGAAGGPVTISAGSVPTSVLTLAGSGGIAQAQGNDLTFSAPVSVTAATFSLLADASRTLTFSELRGTVSSPGSAAWAVGGAGVVRIGAGGLAVSSTGPNNGLAVTVSGGSTLQLTASQDWQPTTTGITVNGSGTLNLGGAGQTLTVRPSGSAGQPVPGVVLNAVLTGGAGLTLTPVGGTAPGDGLLQIVATGASNNVPNTTTGPLTVNGGTLGVAGNGGAAWAGTSVSVTAGQLLPGSVLQPLVPFTNPLPAATTLSLTGSGAYNLGAPDLATGSMAAATPLRHAQTYASVTHASSGAFHTGAAVGGFGVTVSGTFTHSGAGSVNVSPGGILSVNQLDLPSGGGPVTVQGGPAGPALLTVGSGGLSMAGRTITLNAGGVGASLSLNGTVTSTGTSLIQNTGPAGSAGIALNGQRTFNVTSGTLTVPETASGGVTKQGAGTLVLNGARQGTTNFDNRVEAGKLTIAAVGALGTNSTLTFAGGTVSTAGGAGGAGVAGQASRLRFDPVAAGGVGTLELGTGAHVLAFTDFQAISGTGTFALTITGWQGPAGGSGTAG